MPSLVGNVAVVGTVAVTTSAGKNIANIRSNSNPAMQFIGDGDHTGLEFVNYGATFLPVFNAIKARGSQASPTGVTTNDTLFRIAAVGYYDNAGSGVKASAGGQIRIEMRAGEAWSSSAQGTYTRFDSVINGETTLTERGRIHTNGRWGFGNAAPVGQVHAQAAAAAVIALIAQGASSQSANLQEWQTSATTVVGAMSVGGILTNKGITTVHATGVRSQFTGADNILIELQRTGQTAGVVGVADDGSPYFANASGTALVTGRAGVSGGAGAIKAGDAAPSSTQIAGKELCFYRASDTSVYLYLRGADGNYRVLKSINGTTGEMTFG